MAERTAAEILAPWAGMRVFDGGGTTRPHLVRRCGRMMSTAEVAAFLADVERARASSLIFIPDPTQEQNP